MKKLLSLAIIASMTMASCSKEENPIKINNTQDKEIMLAAGISANTKVAYNPANAVPGVQFLRIEDASGVTAPSFASVNTVISGNIAETTGAITFGTTQNYDKVDDQYAWFVGYHPVLETNNTWSITGDKDIMTTAEPVNAGKYSAPMTDATMAFEHRLAQLVIKCETASGVSANVANAFWGAITKIEVVGVKNTATYTKGVAALSFDGSGDITLRAADMETLFAGATIGTGNEVAGAMLAPVSGSDVLIKLRISTQISGKSVIEKEVDVTMTSFAASTRNTITLSFGATDVAIGAKASIGEWVSGGTGTGEMN